MTFKSLLLVGSLAAAAGLAAPVAISPALADGYPASVKPTPRRAPVKRPRAAPPAPATKVIYVDRPVDRVVEKIVERRVEVPVDRVVERVVEKVVRVPVERIVDRPVYVDRPVDRPVDRVVEKIVERRVEVPVERIVEKIVEKPVYIDRPVDRPVDRIIEKVIRVPVERVVERPVYIERSVPDRHDDCRCGPRHERWSEAGGREGYKASGVIFDQVEETESMRYESSSEGYSYGGRAQGGGAWSQGWDHSGYADPALARSQSRYGPGGGWNPRGVITQGQPDGHALGGGYVGRPSGSRRGGYATGHGGASASSSSSSSSSSSVSVSSGGHRSH